MSQISAKETGCAPWKRNDGYHTMSLYMNVCDADTTRVAYVTSERVARWDEFCEPIEPGDVLDIVLEEFDHWVVKNGRLPNQPDQRELSRQAADKALEDESKKRRQRMWDATYAATFGAMAANAFKEADSPDEFNDRIAEAGVLGLVGAMATRVADVACKYDDARLASESFQASCKVCVDSTERRGICVKCGRTWR